MKSQLRKVEKEKAEMLDSLKEQESEIGKLQKENNQFAEEKTVLLNKLVHLQQN